MDKCTDSGPFQIQTVQQRLFNDFDAYVELRVQEILSTRRNANASGQAGEDIENIRTAIRAAGSALMALQTESQLIVRKRSKPC